MKAIHFILIFVLSCLMNISQAQTSKKQTQSTKKASTKVTTKKQTGKPTKKANVVAANGLSGDSANGSSVVEIKIEGNKKIEKDAILAQLKMKEGDVYTSAKVRDEIKALFALGYFNNIQVDKVNTSGGVILTYQVTEKPVISEIDYDGNFELKDEDLAEAVGIKVYEILNLGKIKEAEDKILKAYEDKGFFLARVKAEIADKADNTSKVIFKIQENDKVRVKKITFIGNKKIKDGFLKDRMLTKEGGFFSFMSGSGAYKQEAFDRDVQLLKFLYFNEGYIQVKVDRPQVFVSPDKKSIYITIRVEEGEQFEVGEIDFSGDMLFSRAQLLEAIQTDELKIFSYEQLQKDLSELQAKYGDLGYAFANVIPRNKVDEASRKVHINFEFDKGQKVYFGQINIIGNTKTRDKVVRRELKITEGELYNETRKRESLENIQRLGFFEEVNFKTSTPVEKQNQLNIDIVVKERNTGSIQFGAGYGSSSGFTLQGQVNQANFLGKGQNLGASLNVSGAQSNYSLNFTEPHYNDTDWSLGGSVYQSLTGKDSTKEFEERKAGGTIELGHPLAEYFRGFLALKYDYTDLRKRYDSDGVLITDTDLYPLDTASGSTISLKGSLVYDKRNDRFAPSKGMYASLSVEYAGIGGDLKYTKSFTTLRYFKKIFWDVVLRNNITYGVISSNDASIDPPFNELFLLGGPYSLRGFRWGRIGKRVFSQKTYDKLVADNPSIDTSRARDLSMKAFGGTQQLYYTAEFEFPLVQEAGIKGVVFYDIGQAEDAITDENFFSDVGFGFRWFSPIGPLRFEWGIPLNRNPIYHEASVFEFSIGAPF